MSLPKYPAYKDSGVGWLGQIPSGWDAMRLKQAASVNDDALPETTSPEFELAYVDIGSVSLDRGIERTESFDFQNAPSRARRVVRHGDVLVSTVRTYLKAIAPVVHPPENMVVSTGFAVIRPNHKLRPQYAKYVLQATGFVHEVIARSTGVSYPAINASDLVRISIPVPPLDEQATIAALLERETAKIDALIAEQEKLIKLLAEKRQATISRLVARGLNPDAPLKNSGVAWLGQVPAHWEIERLGALFRQVKRQGFEDKDVLSVYRDFGVIRKDSRVDNFNKTPEDLSLYQLVMPNDLVVNKMKGWQGSLGISSLEGITSPDYMVFMPLHLQDSRYLHLLLRSASMVSVYRSISNGIRPAQWRLEPEAFLALRVVLPPVDEQERIAAFCLGEMGQLDLFVEETAVALDLLRERRAALVTAAVTGQVDVRGAISRFADQEEIAA